MSIVPQQHRLPEIPDQVDGLLLALERFVLNPEIPADKLERVFALQRELLAKRAEDEFNAAMSAAQSEMGRVSADAENPQTRSRYASYSQIDRAIRPIYTRHGFALSFGEADSPKAEHVRVLCYVTHRGGYTRMYYRDMPADGLGAKGGAVMTRTHASGAAQTYGMRYLLKGIFNVAIGEDDTDGNVPMVKKITESEAADVEALIQESGRDRAKFLKFYKIERVADLAAADLAGAVAELTRVRK